MLDRPGDGAAVAAVLAAAHEDSPRAGHGRSQTLLLVGADDDSPRAWLRCGRALALVLLVLHDAGLDVDWSAAAGDAPELRLRLQHEFGLLGSPQLMVAVA